LPPGFVAELGRDLRLVSAGGGRRSPETVRVLAGAHGTEEVAAGFGAATGAVGLWATDPLGVPVLITSMVVTTRSGSSYGLDGPLSAYLTAPHWVAAGTIGPFAVFSNARARGSFWLAGSAVNPVGRLRVRVLRSSPFTPGEEVALTVGAPATVARAVADIPGWSATGSHDGRPTAIVLRRDGLVQSFDVPKGTTLVTFKYTAPGLRAGLATSALGLVAIVVLGLAAIASSRQPGGPVEPAGAGGQVGPALARRRRAAPR
jgi:hypothetical protein